MSNHFAVVYLGQLMPDADINHAVDQLVKLFNSNEKTIRALLNSQRAIVKGGLTHMQAELYQERLAQCGVQVVVEEIQPEAVEPLTPAAQESVVTHSAFEPVMAAPLSAHRDSDSEKLYSKAKAEEQAQRDLTIEVKAFSFTGNGSEYFRIWIVNVLLTIVTLGIYGPWAKVRNHQYFYNNLWLDNDNFQYHASPIAILKGRLLALAVLALWFFASHFFAPLTFIMVLAYIAVLPWIVIRGIRFNALNSSYRNIRFNYNASYGEAVMAVYVWPIASMLSVGLLVPFAMRKMDSMLLNNAVFGQSKFKFECKVGEYYTLFLIFIAIVVTGGVVGGILSALVSPLLLGLSMMLAYGIGIAYFMSAHLNLRFSKTSLEQHTFSADFEPKGMIGLYLKNTLLIMLTLGLYYPAAQVNVARYKAEHIHLVAEGSLDNFVAGEAQQQSAVADELGNALDVDVSFV
ncbi:MAG: DUF898 domain-containing protein [Oceanospirillaceae bacterium]|nr:DUF898 domain-containing protein [Oceanospirillaceae bacterium]MCP5336070.1 DUF898 domain-containing protein [Oceanospirillaceae bacterium]